MQKKMTPRMHANIVASLQDQLLDVSRDIISLDEWRRRAQGAIDRGVTLPPRLMQRMS